MNLSDEAIAGEVLLAFRRIGQGEASLPLAATECFRALLGLSHEAGREHACGNPPRTDTGD